LIWLKAATAVGGPNDLYLGQLPSEDAIRAADVMSEGVLSALADATVFEAAETCPAEVLMST